MGGVDAQRPPLMGRDKNPGVKAASSGSLFDSALSQRHKISNYTSFDGRDNFAGGFMIV